MMNKVSMHEIGHTFGSKHRSDYLSSVETEETGRLKEKDFFNRI